MAESPGETQRARAIGTGCNLHSREPAGASGANSTAPSRQSGRSHKGGRRDGGGHQKSKAQHFLADLDLLACLGLCFTIFKIVF